MLRKIVSRYQIAGIAGLARSALRRVAPQRYQRLFEEPSPLLPILRKLATQPRFSIIQIGAYVGDSENDPLVAFFRKALPNSPGARIVLVEPVKSFFDQLKRNYADLPGVRFENVAIAEKRGEREFYYLDCDPVAYGHPEWMRQLSSLREDRMTSLWESYEANKELQQFYLDHRASFAVRCVTLEDILVTHDIGILDFLQIDAEGYDFEILKSVDFKRIKPRFINFEHALLSTVERAECRAMLESVGYIVHESNGADTLCQLNRSEPNSYRCASPG